MTKKLPKHKAKSTRKPQAVPHSEQLEKAMQRVAAISQKSGARVEKTQREARAAIAETINLWLDWLEDENPEQMPEFFAQIAILATAANRSKIGKHVMMPAGLMDEVEAIIAKQQEEQEAAEQAEAAKAETATQAKAAKGNQEPEIA